MSPAPPLDLAFEKSENTQSVKSQTQKQTQDTAGRRSEKSGWHPVIIKRSAKTTNTN